MATGGTTPEEAKPKTWIYRYKGGVYGEAHITMAQAESIEDRLGISWYQINPTASAKHARVILAVLYAARHDAVFDEVYAELGEIKATKWLADMLEFVDSDLPELFVDGNPPTAEAVHSTGG